MSTNNTKPALALVENTVRLSPFARRTLDADANLLPELLEGYSRSFAKEEMSAFLAALEISDEAKLKCALRKLRKNVILRLMMRDLNGLADLFEVMLTMTNLAEVTVNLALDHLAQWLSLLHGSPVSERGIPQQLIVIGMGKLGGGELNVSSDIDLIFAYEEDGETSGEQPISNHEYFTRLGKKLINALNDSTSDGFVFRVDMRLRPYGDSGPLLGSLAMLEEYYQTQGREWERYAWIKGRIIAGPEQAMMSLIRPFIFRKYFDYGAFTSIRELKLQIVREVLRREMNDNIKLGPGGIREIEFIAQAFQLIRGGQDVSLQSRSTLAVLKLLSDKGLLPQHAAMQLQGAYVFLRNLEHRLQYLHDAQTQMLPTAAEDRARIAAGMKFAGWSDFYAELETHRKYVQSLFEEVFSTTEVTVDEVHPLLSLWQGALADSDAEVRLGVLGYRDPAAIWDRLKRLNESARIRQLPVTSRQRFDALAPVVIQVAAGFANPDETLARMFDLLDSICQRASYLALLVEYPQTLSLVAHLASISPWLAAYLQQHPILLDELLDKRTLYAVPDFAELSDDLERRLAAVGDDVERQLDILRHFKHIQVFRFAAQDLTGELRLETLSDYLSALADMMLDATLRHAWTGLRGCHRDQSRFAVIGYGKLGGKELGYASDLDIVFLYDDDAPDAAEIYARFGQRISAWLNSLTPAGLLYETDLRLRPDGVSGLLVSSVQSFDEYQRHKAWTWEHQALTRARYCAGDRAIGAVFERIREEVICQPRDPQKLCDEVIAMRRKMQEGHLNNTQLFDLKHDQGGIVDVEFVVQYLVLAHANRYQVLVANLGNIALLKMAGELGLIPDRLAQDAADAYRAYRREQHLMRLQGEGKARCAPDLFAGQRKVVSELWQQTLGTYPG